MDILIQNTVYNYMGKIQPKYYIKALYSYIESNEYNALMTRFNDKQLHINRINASTSGYSFMNE